MDLKTFAVHRKLAFDDELLGYVVKDEPVPIPVIESAFGDMIAPLQDEKSEALIANYPKMLQENIPLIVKFMEDTGGYEVSGDIPDSLVDAISLVHNVEPEDMIGALVQYNLSTVQGQSCDILDTSLTKETDRTRMNMEAIPNVQPVQEDVQSMDEAVLGFDEPVMEDMDTPVMEDIDEPVMEESMDESVMESMDEPVIEESTEELPVMDEEFDKEDDMASEEEKKFIAAMHSIYDRFCNDIRAYQLDQRLNLDMAS